MKDTSSRSKNLLSEEGFLDLFSDGIPLRMDYWDREEPNGTPVPDDLLIVVDNAVSHDGKDKNLLSDTEISLLKLKIINTLRDKFQ